MKNLIQNILEMNLDNSLIILLVTISVINFKSVHLNDEKFNFLWLKINEIDGGGVIQFNKLN